MPRDELISYILNYREKYPDEFINSGVRFKTKRLAKQLSLISNKLYVFKLNDDAFKLIDIESLTVEEKEAVLNVIKAIETVNPNNNEIETEIIKDKAFLYGFAESIIVKAGNEKLYLISFSDIKTK